MTRLGLQIDDRTKQKLKEKAENKGLSLSGYSRMALKERVERDEKKDLICPYCTEIFTNKADFKEHVKGCFE